MIEEARRGRKIRLGGGRALGYDDVGPRDGVPVLYVHGTPDSRRARHPSDALTDQLGVRLVVLEQQDAQLAAGGADLRKRRIRPGGGAGQGRTHVTRPGSLRRPPPSDRVMTPPMARWVSHS